jgi:formylglycine-generating enzyme required for sulfatase activity
MRLMRKVFCRPRPATWANDDSFETVSVDSTGSVVNRTAVRCRIVHQELAEGIELDMVVIPSGIFRMGTLHFEGYRDEEPPHTVHIKSFLMSKTTITQAQWKAVMGRLPPCRGKSREHPVDRISWFDGRSFCERLSKITGNPYRLPSEAEWEYACRAGSASAFCYGEMITTDLCNYVGLHSFAGGPKGEYRHGPIPPRRFPPNAFGLYDMHGNLWEWCADRWHESYLGAPDDGGAWTFGGSSERVLRGGSWHDPPVLCRSASRLKLEPSEGEDFVGLRIASSGGTGLAI